MTRRPSTLPLSLLILLSAAVLSPDGALAQNPNLGTSGAQFLQIPVGARAAGMGGAFTAPAADASALYWNPAGIVRVPGAEFFAGHTAWWGGIQLNHAAFAQTFDAIGSVGLSMTLLTMSKMEITTELQPEGTGQTFDAQDLMIGVSYARTLTEDFAVGVTAKFVSQRIWNTTASGIAFDVGTQYRVGFRDLTIAMSMTNFGSDLTYDGRDLQVKYDASGQNPNNRLTPARLQAEEFPLPLHFQVGVSMTAVDREGFRWLLAADATHPNDNRERINTGMELTIADHFVLRGGYRFGYDTESFTLGAGVIVPLGSGGLMFDYAYAAYDPLPDIHRLSVGVRL